MRDLTTEEKEILAHVVVDPDAWWLHCQNHKKPGFDCEKALADKCARWKPEMEVHKDEHKENYKTRAVRQAEEDQAAAEKAAEAQAANEAAQEAKQAEFDNAVAAKVNEILIAKGLIPPV